MMKEKDIRTFIPFIAFILGLIFLSGADIFDPSPPIIYKNPKQEMFHVSGDIFLSIVCFGCAAIAFKVWLKAKKRNAWYSDLAWQFAGVCACWGLLAIIRIWGSFQMFLWLQGLFRWFAAIFTFYFLNTMYAARHLFYDPPTTEELKKRNKLLEDFIHLIKKENNGG